MNLDYVIQAVENKVRSIKSAKTFAYEQGDLDKVNVHDTELQETEETLTKIKGLIKE